MNDEKEKQLAMALKKSEALKLSKPTLEKKAFENLQQSKKMHSPEESIRWLHDDYLNHFGYVEALNSQ